MFESISLQKNMRQRDMSKRRVGKKQNWILFYEMSSQSEMEHLLNEPPVIEHSINCRFKSLLHGSASAVILLVCFQFLCVASLSPILRACVSVRSSDNDTVLLHVT